MKWLRKSVAAKLDYVIINDCRGSNETDPNTNLAWCIPVRNRIVSNHAFNQWKRGGYCV